MFKDYLDKNKGSVSTTKIDTEVEKYSISR